MNIPERSLEPPEPKRTELSDCYQCGEPVYQDQDHFQIDENRIHEECIKKFRVWGE